MQKSYREKRNEAEARLSQFEVDYDDPLDFLDKCIVVGSMLLYLHKKFNYELKKNLLKAVFERIDVENRSIVKEMLNPPFSLLLGHKLNKLFKNRPSEATKEDIFEQIVSFTLSEQYVITKSLVFPLAREKSLFFNKHHEED